LKYDRRSDPDYIELLELGLQKEGDKVDLGMNCEEWEVYLNNLDVGWKEAPKRIRSCDRHPWVGGEPMRIHQYMLEW
jgi:phage terminase small subunit